MSSFIHAKYDTNRDQVIDPNDESGSSFQQPITINPSGTPANITNPLVQATGNVNSYTQTSTQNKSNGVNSSADMICYPDNVTSSDATGFVDMGVCSSAFAQAAYGITVANEAYLFGSAPSGAGKTGNLIIATDGTGSENSVWFGTGGFTAKANIRAGFDGAASGAFTPYAVGGISLGKANKGFSKLYIDYTNTGTVGAVTINKAAGRVNIAAAGTSIVVTNSLVTANSLIMCIVSTNDATAYVKNVVPAAGSFTINLGAAATAQTSVDFFVVGTD